MRERKLRSTAESLERLRRSLIPYTYYIYKIQRKVKSKNTMRICSLSVPRLKDEWNQTVWSVNNLRCGTAACHLVPPPMPHEVNRKVHSYPLVFTPCISRSSAIHFSKTIC